MEVAIVTDQGVDIGALVLARVGDAYRLARAILRDDGEAEDAVQEASFVAWRRQGSLRDPQRFEAWFDRILVNQCRDRLRRRKRSVQLAPPEIAIEAAGREAGPDARGADPDIDRALAALDIDHRVVGRHALLAGPDGRGHCRSARNPRRDVKSRLHNALKALRGSLVAARIEEIRHG